MFTLFFLLTVLGCFVSFIVIIVALIRHKAQQAGITFLGVLGYIVLYVVALVLVGLLSPQTVLGSQAERCFDEMCFSISHVSRTSNVGHNNPSLGNHQIYYIVSVQLRNSSARTAQKPNSPYFYLNDGLGHHIAIDSATESLLGQSPAWNSKLQPGETQVRDLAFIVSSVVTSPRLAVGEGGWPTPLIIGDDNSFFHKQTEIQLSV